MCVCMCVRVHLMFVCAGKGELGEEKNLPDLLTEQYFQNTPTRKKKKTPKKTNKKNNPPGYIPAPKPAPPSIDGKQTQHWEQH